MANEKEHFIYKVKEPVTIDERVYLPVDTEIDIIDGVVYWDGLPLEDEIQPYFRQRVLENKDKLKPLN